MTRRKRVVRVWVSRDSEKGKFTIWGEKPTKMPLSGYSVAAFTIEIPQLGLKPGECREYELVPVRKVSAKGRGKPTTPAQNGDSNGK